MVKYAYAIFSTCLLSYSCSQVNVGKHGNNDSTSVTNNSVDVITNNKKVKQDLPVITDSTSIDYLIQLFNNEDSLNHYWAQKLRNIGDYWFVLDPAVRISLTRNWKINDSISVLVIGYATGVSSDEILFTAGKNNNFISQLHISNGTDRDLSAESYSYSEYKVIDKKTIELLMYELTGPEDQEKVTVIIEQWTIQENGRIIKIK